MREFEKVTPMLPRHRIAALLALALPLTAGCELQSLFDDLQNDSTLVDVLVTHHATPEDGMFPDRGGEGEMRVFQSDEGWTIQLVDAIIVTSATTLHECDDASVAIDMYWGALPEDISGRDLDTLTLGSTKVDSAEFCGLTVHYGPYVPGADAAPRSNEKIDGATLYLRGAATKDATTIPFEIRVTDSVDVDLDLSTIVEGGPLHVDGSQDFPTELTVGKTYDRFFDGIDFATATQSDLQAHTLAVLALETTVDVGRVTP
jgi:hypothetical protein